MRKRLEILLAFALLVGAAGFAAYELDVFEVPTGPSCADPCVVMGDRYNTGTEEWILYLAHCPDLESLAACEQDHPYIVTNAEWKSYRPGMRYNGVLSER